MMVSGRWSESCRSRPSEEEKYEEASLMCVCIRMKRTLLLLIVSIVYESRQVHEGDIPGLDVKYHPINEVYMPPSLFLSRPSFCSICPWMELFDTLSGTAFVRDSSDAVLWALWLPGTHFSFSLFCMRLCRHAVTSSQGCSPQEWGLDISTGKHSANRKSGQAA